MGLLFGKKKKGEAGVGPIRKANEPAQPRDTKRVRVAEEANSTRSTSTSVAGRAPSDSTGSRGGNGNNNGGSTNGGTTNGTGNANAGLDPIFTRMVQQDASINGFGKGNAGGSGGGTPGSNSHGSNGVTGGSVGSGGGDNGMNTGGSGYGGGDGGGNADGTQPYSEDMMRQSPLDRVVNLYGISLGIFNITRAVLSVQEWNDALFIQLMEAAVVDLERELRVIKDPDRLRDWVHPLHYRKTGSVIGAGRRIQQSHKYFMEWALKLKQTGGEGFGPAEQRQFKDTLKEMVRTFLQLLTCCEMVVTADFNAEINELARTMRDVVDTSSGKLNYVFDDVARICTSCSIRLGRLALWKSLQVTNVSWSRSVNDTCYTVTKATKVLYIVGERLYRNMTDQTAYDNLTALTKGVVMQIKKLQGMVQTEPPEQRNVVITFTPEVIQEHTQAYDQGIKEVSSSLSVYVKKNMEDLTVIGSINKIISQLEAIKNTVRTPDNSALVVAVASISDSVEKFCGAIYHALYHLGDDNEVLKEQIMETMQHILHCTIQLQLVAVTKGLYFTIINPEATMLTCLRSLLLAVSIIIDAIDYMKTDALVDTNGDSGSITLVPEEINEAIVYILHYGRPLYKGEGEEPQEEQFTTNNPSTAPSTPPSTTTTTTTSTSVGTTTTTTTTSTKTTNVDRDDQANSDEDETRVYSNDNNNNNDNNTDNNIINQNDDDANEGSEEDTGVMLVLPGTAKKPQNQDTGGGSSGGAASGASQAGPGSPDLTASEEELLKCNPDNFSDTNLPPGFDPAPAKPVYVKGSTQEQYKAYMVSKYEYETWENKLILYKIKVKKQIEELKAKKGIK